MKPCLQVRAIVGPDLVLWLQSLPHRRNVASQGTVLNWKVGLMSLWKLLVVTIMSMKIVPFSSLSLVKLSSGYLFSCQLRYSKKLNVMPIIIFWIPESCSCINLSLSTTHSTFSIICRIHFYLCVLKKSMKCLNFFLFYLLY